MIYKQNFNILALMLIIFFGLATFPPTAFAQEKKNADVKSLGDILNQPKDYGNDGKPLTSAIMANHYYKICTSKKNLAFDEEETKILCGCNAAEMSELLSVQEFKDLDKNTRKGKDARGKSLAYAYAPCMKHVIEKKVKYDCYVSRKLDDIVVGKKTLCKCVVNNFKSYFDQSATDIIMRATHNDPMTMNPLEDFFMETNYRAQHDHYIQQCRFEFLYNKEN
ncbi:MAG: hypothetical protein COA45_11060 [Zetaproteobacteria bacterium]|nr:MAG: hypothetical protein COA45_11060 [Zetaproteobacteria bacterium]